MITLRTIEDIVKRHVRPLLARVNNAAVRGVLQTLDDEPGLARGQTTTVADQVADDIEFVTPYGLSFRPAAGAETIAWSINGSARHILGMIFDRRIRLKNTLAAGEVALHVGRADHLVHLQADGTVVVRAGTTGGMITVRPNGDVVVVPGAAGKIYLGEDGAPKKIALADDVDARLNTISAVFNAHVHAGVTAGPGSTAVTPTLIGALAPTGAANVYGKG